MASPRTEQEEQERAPLVPASNSESQGKMHGVLLVIVTCATQIGLSAGLINYNKFVMAPEHFPYAVVLTSMHMLSSFVLASLLYLLGGDSYFPGMKVVKQEGTGLIKKLLPLSVFFAVSVALSNEAYRYSTVPFLQMCKQGNIVLVYVVGLLMLVEKWNMQQALVLFVIFCGCVMAVRGEITFSRLGFMVQVGSQCCEVIKIMLQQKLMHGLKLDPLTTVMVMSPACLISLSLGMYFVWAPGIVQAAGIMWPHLVMNCVNAFALNVAVAAVIKVASGLSFVITGVIKDIVIVTSAATFFGAVIANQQIIGFSIATMGIAVHSIIRTLPEMTRDHGISKAVCYAMLGMQPTVRQPGDVESGK